MSSILSDDEVITFMGSVFGIGMTKHQLQNPDRDFVINILVPFLHEFGFTNHDQPDLQAVTAAGITNIQTYDTMFILTNVFKQTQYLVSKINPNFEIEMADIITPTKRRMMRIVSLMCFLYLKLQTIKHEWAKFEEKNQDAPERKSQVDKTIRDLKKEIETKSLKWSNIQSDFERNKKILAEKGKEYNIVTGNKDEVETKKNELKLKIIKKKEEISENQFKQSQLQEDIAGLQEQLVKSPGKIQGELKSKEGDIEKIREDKRKLEDEYYEVTKLSNAIKSKIDLQEGNDKKIKAFLKDLEQIQKEYDDHNDSEGKSKSLEAACEELMIKIKSIEQSTKQLERDAKKENLGMKQQIKNINELIKGLKQDNDKKIMWLEKKRNELFGEKSRLEQLMTDKGNQHKEKMENLINQKNNIDMDLAQQEKIWKEKYIQLKVVMSRNKENEKEL